MSMPTSVMCPQRVPSEIHQAHVGQVVRGVVIRVQTHSFRADRIVGRAQRRRGLGVVDDGPDLVAEELRELVVGRTVAHHVGVHIERFEQLADFPGAFVALSPFRRRDGKGRGHAALHRHAASGDPRRFAVCRLVLGQLCELLRRGRTVVGRDREVRGALEHDKLPRLPGDERNRLDAEEPVPMTATRLPVKSTRSWGQRLVKYTSPANRSMPSMSTSLGIDRQPVAITKNRQVMSSSRSVRTCHNDRRVIPSGSCDSGAELDVAAEVELVGDVVQVAQDLRLRGVLLRPLPIAVPFRVEAVHVVDAGYVDTRARVPIPVPRATEIAGRVENAHGVTLASEAIDRVEPREPRADDNDVHIGCSDADWAHSLDYDDLWTARFE